MTCKTAAVAAAWLIGATPCEATEVEKGRALAVRICAVCHLNEGQGEKQTAVGVPGFRAIAGRPGQNIDSIVRWLQSAPPMMPDHRLSLDESYSLAEYILSLRDAR